MATASTSRRVCRRSPTGHFGYLPLYQVPLEAVGLARRAVELDDSDPWAYLALGYVAFVARQTDDAAAQYRRAVELNPNFAAAYGYWGYALAFDGRSEEAVERISLAMRMSPHDRQNAVYMGGMAVSHISPAGSTRRSSGRARPSKKGRV